jgi:ABC-2 type transport system permease protein
LISKLWALALRDIEKWIRNPFLILMMTAQPLTWLMLFGKAFNPVEILNFPPETLSQIPPSVQNSVINILGERLTNYLDGVPDYFTYIAVGTLCTIVLFTTSFSGLSIITDRQIGYLDRLLALPVSKITILFSRITSSMLRSLAQAGVVFVIALALGMKIDSSLTALELLGGILALSLLSFGLSCFFVAFSVRAKSIEARAILVNLVNVPLMFTSNALYPLKQMPSWLQPVASVNPITHAADALRLLIVRGSELGAPDLLDRLMADLTYLTLFSAIGLIVAILSTKLLKKY